MYILNPATKAEEKTVSVPKMVEITKPVATTGNPAVSTNPARVAKAADTKRNVVKGKATKTVKKSDQPAGRDTDEDKKSPDN